MKQIQGKKGLLRDIGRFGRPTVREIGIPPYCPLYLYICLLSDSLVKVTDKTNLVMPKTPPIVCRDPQVQC